MDMQLCTVSCEKANIVLGSDRHGTICTDYCIISDSHPKVQLIILIPS